MKWRLRFLVSLSVFHSLVSLTRPVTLLRLQATAKWISGAADLISGHHNLSASIRVRRRPAMSFLSETLRAFSFAEWCTGLAGADLVAPPTEHTVVFGCAQELEDSLPMLHFYN